MFNNYLHKESIFYERTGRQKSTPRRFIKILIFSAEAEKVKVGEDKATWCAEMKAPKFNF